MTARGNLVAVITNGTAVLGLGNIGPLAAKPVMEGKAVLFKKFSGLDAIDIEIAENDPDKLVEVIAALEPSFGGINLEDIKAPECFIVEAKLRARMKIPVFHDDQHGTAIIVAAAVTNWLRITGRKLNEFKLVSSGAGAAAIACMDLLVDMGVPVENITVTDIAGVVYEGRNEHMDPRKDRYAKKTSARTLAEVLPGADVFLGLSAAGVLKPDMIKEMGKQPLILALANPTPEIMPELVREVRPDAIMATGRSDYPNQVNNVLCFPFVFRGALDVGATTINEAMKIACVHALADLALVEASDVVATAYGGETAAFGPEYLIPKPFDPRLITQLAPAVAKAAMGFGRRDAADHRLRRISRNPRTVRLPLRPGHAADVLARQSEPPAGLLRRGRGRTGVARGAGVVDEHLARPLLIGRTEVVDRRIEKLGLRIRRGDHFDLVDPESDPRYHEYWTSYHEFMARRGVTPAHARQLMRTNTTVIGSMLMRKGEADALVCGTVGQYQRHLKHVLDVIGLARGVKKPAALNVLILDKGTFFIIDTYVSYDPSPAEIAEATLLAAEQVRRFGLEPKVAMLSHSNFGTHDDPPARKMRDALGEVLARDPDLEVEGEMHADAAVSEEIREAIFPQSKLRGTANLLVMPTPGCGQHLVQSAEGSVGRPVDRPDPAGRATAGAHPDPVGHGARHRQHLGHRRRRRPGAGRGASRRLRRRNDACPRLRRASFARNCACQQFL